MRELVPTYSRSESTFYSLQESCHESSILHMDRDHLRGYWRNVFVVIWRGQVTDSAIQGIEKDLDLFVKNNPEGIVYVVIAERTARIPRSVPVRKLASVLASHDGHYLGTAAILEGGKLRSTLLRACFETISWRMRNSCHSKPFFDLTDAADWLAANFLKASDAAASAEFKRGVLALRASYTSPASEPDDGLG